MSVWSSGKRPLNASSATVFNGIVAVLNIFSLQHGQIRTNKLGQLRDKKTIKTLKNPAGQTESVSFLKPQKNPVKTKPKEEEPVLSIHTQNNSGFYFNNSQPIENS